MSCTNSGKECTVCNQCNLHINGYKIFDIDEDAMYVSKSKEDLLENILKYGDIEEVYGISQEQMFDEVREVSLCSDEAQKERDWADEYVKCVYDLYKEAATVDQGTQMILCYNL